MQTEISLGLDALGLGQRIDIVARLGIEIDQAFREAAADGDLVHIGIRRVQHGARLGHRHHRQRIGHRLGGERGAFQGIERDIHRQAALSDFFADKQHGRFVALAFTDHHRAVDRKDIERSPHRFHRRLVGGMFVAPPDLRRGGDGGRFGDAHRFQRKGTIQRLNDGRGADQRS